MSLGSNASGLGGIPLTFNPAIIGRPPSDGGDADSICLLTFGGKGSVVGAVSSLVGPRGEVVQVSRASSATVIVDGVEYTAAPGQARVTRDGLLLEPACTNLFVDVTNLTTANWGTVGATITSGAADPLGGTSAFTVTEDTSTGAHEFYQLITSTSAVQTFSFYVKPGSRSAWRIATNSAAFVAAFSLVGMGSVLSTTGTGARGEVEYIGGGWYRISLCCNPGVTALVALAADAGGGTYSYAGNGSVAGYAWRPQWELNPYATTWTATSRAPETALVTLPRGMPAEWCLDVTALPAGAGSWNRGTEDVLAAFGPYGSTNSVELYVNSGTAVASVRDNANAERHVSSNSLQTSGGSPYGSRVLTARSGGVTRPAVAVDGIDVGNGASGSGTGQLASGIPPILYLGCNSTGSLTGGFVIREVRLRSTSTPAYPPLGIYWYTWQLTRGYCTSVFAALGDSLTAGIYDPSITHPYPQGAAALLGSSWAAHNYGNGGNTTSQMLARWRRDIRGRGYTKMVVWGGINDVNTSVPYAQTIANLRTIWAEAQADGIRVYPVTLMGGANAGGSAREVARLAINAAIRASGLTVIDADAQFTVFSGGVNKIAPAYDIDGGSLHINDAGQVAFASTVQAALAS